MTPEELKEAGKEMIREKREAAGKIAEIIAGLKSRTGLSVKSINIFMTNVNTADGSRDYIIHSVELETDFN